MSELKSWVEVSKDSDFSIHNLPFGIFSSEGKAKRAGIAIGSKIVDLEALSGLGYLKNQGIDPKSFSTENLNIFILQGKQKVSLIRKRVQELLNAENNELQYETDHKEVVLIDIADAQMHMPVQVGDYTDFYSSKEHATNVGTMFRDPNNALLPNWLHIPVGYHGRASSIVVSGTPIHRPKGQTKPNENEPPVFGASKLLDFELEMGFITYQGKPMGDSISVKEAEDNIFGMLLFNDWSARDIQKWEYVPLGPFLGKNFASSVSPWVVTMDALEPFRVKSPEQNPTPLPYLQHEGNNNFDINLETYIQPEGQEPHKVCASNFKHMYWSMAQQLAHHTVNGCNIKAGDICASGTISGPTEDSYGSMLELSWKGTKPIQMPDGSERKFIHDNDSVIMKGWCEKDGIRVGFGEVNSKILPAK